MPDSLFDAFGGKTAILAAVNSFYRRMLADENLSKFFTAVDVEALRSRQSMFLTMLIGGPVSDSAQYIRNAHQGSRTLGLNDADFDAALIHFRAALEEVGVSPEPLERTMKLLEGTRSAVLGH